MVSRMYFYICKILLYCYYIFIIRDGIIFIIRSSTTFIIHSSIIFLL